MPTITKKGFLKVNQGYTGIQLPPKGLTMNKARLNGINFKGMLKHVIVILLSYPSNWKMFGISLLVKSLPVNDRSLKGF